MATAQSVTSQPWRPWRSASRRLTSTPLDADRRRLAEAHGDPVLVGERRLDDLLLHLAVQAERELVAQRVLAQADERVLLDELSERDVE
jgi:hypothetical protein